MNPKLLDINLAKIESLEASFYEKDVIRSAFYNFLNNIPISSDSQALMQKYCLRFTQQGIVIKDSKNTQQRKNQYKRTYQSRSIAKNYSQKPQIDDIKVYRRNYLNHTHTESQQIIAILQESNVLNSESVKLIAQCKDLVAICFTPNELSYHMVTTVIANISDSITKNMLALHEFLTPFLDLFDSLHDSAKQEILNKASLFLQTIRELKEISVNLCIKLSAIRAKSVLKQESNINEYLENTIQKMEAYLK
ncbi:hypothetical protein [Helicobacter sp. MIT 14-3879]|uniref:hypothetical protein n=1 Tax=Helicobacter sp. MIT 14-3879 TaxID=2040649 RepID=UPI000E1EFC58|nr:hypothetical protein [Helicobacter sp. MIT 14-3879]RDU60400.1 hypothetical protein CQA44_10540 [Helicobacter sp. MIT 14-3879]